MEVCNYMRKVYLVVMFLLVASFAFVVAEEPSVAVGEGDVEELQGIIDQLPFDEGGDTNFSKYKPFLTRAEIRIEGINMYLDENAGWMRYIFQMRPQLSLLFVLNLYFILFFFLIMFLNAKGLWFFIESERKARIFGGAVFVIFAVIGLYVGLAYVVNNFLIYIWNVLIPTATWMAVVAMILFGGLLIFALPVAKALVFAIDRYRDTKKAHKEKTEMLASSEAVNKLVEQATKK